MGRILLEVIFAVLLILEFADEAMRECTLYTPVSDFMEPGKRE